MSVFPEILVGIVALLHLGFAYAEIFTWERLVSRVLPQFPREMIAPTKFLAANMGLYNLFLAAGLIWSILIESPAREAMVATFFLICVVIAGVFGAITVSRRFLLVQALPGAIALAAVLWA